MTWKGLPGDCLAATTAGPTCTATATGQFNVTATVTDANGGTSGPSPKVPVAVFTDPRVSGPVLIPESVPVGQTIAIYVTPQGGNSSLYEYQWVGLPNGCAGTSATITCQPQEAGTFHVSVLMTDGNGFSVASSVAWLNVTAPGSLTVLGLPPWEGYAVLGGIAAAIVVGTAVAVHWRRQKRDPPELTETPADPGAGRPPAAP